MNLTGNSDTHLIAFNVSSQLPIKPTPSNFPSWYAQLMSLLVGYDIQGYLDGTIICLSQPLDHHLRVLQILPFGVGFGKII